MSREANNLPADREDGASGGEIRAYVRLEMSSSGETVWSQKDRNKWGEIQCDIWLGDGEAERPEKERQSRENNMGRRKGYDNKWSKKGG